MRTTSNLTKEERIAKMLDFLNYCNEFLNKGENSPTFNSIIEMFKDVTTSNTQKVLKLLGFLTSDKDVKNSWIKCESHLNPTNLRTAEAILRLQGKVYMTKHLKFKQVVEEEKVLIIEDHIDWREPKDKIKKAKKLPESKKDKSDKKDVIRENIGAIPKVIPTVPAEIIHGNPNGILFSLAHLQMIEKINIENKSVMFCNGDLEFNGIDSIKFVELSFDKKEVLLHLFKGSQLIAGYTIKNINGLFILKSEFSVAITPSTPLR